MYRSVLPAMRHTALRRTIPRRGPTHRSVKRGRLTLLLPDLIHEVLQIGGYRFRLQEDVVAFPEPQRDEPVAEAAHVTLMAFELAREREELVGREAVGIHAREDHRCG